MTERDVFCYAFVPEQPLAISPAAVQVKVGPGVLRSATGWDNDAGGGAAFTLWDGMVGPPYTPGAPAGVTGRIIGLSLGSDFTGPLICHFTTGLVIQWSVGFLNAFFLVYR